MSQRIRVILLVGIVLMALGTAFWIGRASHRAAAGSEPSESKAESSPVASVTVAPARFGRITATQDAYGVVQPAAGSTVVISAPFDARVLRVVVRVGSVVEAGAPIVEVTPSTDAALALRLAEETVNAAANALEQTKQRLKEQLATNAEVATATQAERTARTQLESLQRRGIGSTKMLTAERAGIVTQLPAQQGQVVPPGAVLASMASVASLEALLGVEPSLASNLKVGDSVNLRLSDVAQGAERSSVSSHVTSVAGQLNPQTRLRDVALAIPPSAGLLPGRFVVADVPSGTGEGLLVPRSAILLNEADATVFTVVDGKAKKHVVHLGLQNEELCVVVSNDVHPEDLVVTRGALELDDGTDVTIESAGSGATLPTTAPLIGPATEPTSRRSADTRAAS